MTLATWIKRGWLSPAARRPAGGRRPRQPSRELIGSLLEESGDIIIRYDTDLRRVYGNPCFERLTGMAPDDYLGRRPTELSGIGVHALLLEERLRAALASGQPQDFEFEWLCADGQLRWHAVRVLVERDALGRACGLLTVARDVTEHKRAEVALAAREREFRSLAENAEVGILHWDCEGRLRYLNPFCERTLDGAALQAMDTGVAGGALLHAEVKRVAGSGDAATVEYLSQPAAGRGARMLQVKLTAERDGDGRIAGVIGVAHDVTARRRFEQAWDFTTQSAWDEGGEAFFATLTGYLARSLGVDYALVAIVDPADPGFATTVALHAKGSLAPNIRYELQDTPCAGVVERAPCCHPDGLQARFPRCAALVDMGAASYVGVPLLDPAGHSIGLIAVMDGRPMPDAEVVLSVLRIVAARAAAELVRDHAARALRDSERELRLLADFIPDYIARYDAHGGLRYLNPALQRLLGVGLGQVLGLRPTGVDPRLATELAEFERTLDEVLTVGEERELELQVHPSEGGELEVHHVRIAPIRGDDGRPTGALTVGRDVTLRWRTEDAVRQREQEFRALVELSPDFIERYDRNGRRVYVNPALAGVLAARRADPASVFVSEALRYLELVRSVLGSGAPAQAELPFERADASSGWVDVRANPELDADGRVVSVFVVSRDISEMVRQRERIRSLALSDPLTRLHNRQALYDFAPGLIAEAERHGRRLGVLILDLDRFKNVNDTLGHAAGDELLCEVAQRIAETTRGYDLLVRLGGDEFAIIATNLAGELGMLAVAEQISAAMAPPMTVGGHQLVVSASMGIAVFPHDGEQLEDLLAHADTAMYEAKRGGQRYEFYRREFSEQARERLALEHALRGALKAGELELHYQPLVDLRDGRTLGAEALLRWRHPQLGLLAPDRFIQIAEETGLILPIGRWVVEQAALTARRWNEISREPLYVSANVSTTQFLRDDVASLVREALEAGGCKPAWLRVEVTESMLLEDSDCIREALGELQHLGVRVAIDDFGTGYSALGYLGKFDVQCLKIDRRFVRDAGADGRQSELVKGFIGIAGALGMEVVAEGVESTIQAEFLLAQGCRIGQGYLYSRPVTASRFEQALRAGSWAGAACDMAAP